LIQSLLDLFKGRKQAVYEEGLMEAKNYIIIGTGVAGTTSAATIREHDRKGRIVLLGDEELSLYSRIRLPEYLANRVERERLIIHKPEWYSQRRIDLFTGTRAISIDTKTTKVILSDGSSIDYDRLLLATGARSWVPPVKGNGLIGILTVRTMEDVERFKSEIGGRQSRAFVIGGGLLGLEMAGAMISVGLKVSVVEVAPWLLPRQLDREGGELLLRILEKEGIHFHLGAQLDSFAGKDRVRAVRLVGGPELPAEFVLVSAGVEPAVELARETGLQVGRGIIVDDRMAASLPGIYAAGDCAEHRGIVYGIWNAAQDQGRVAGAQMAGGQETYSGSLPNHTLKVSGVNVFSAGMFEIEDESRCERTSTESTYRKVTYDEDGNTIGAILIGDLGERNRILAAISAGRALLR
jgi:NAD(P)H-nitrite reductase large subunit